MPSKQYNNLVREVDRLRKVYLGFNPRIDGKYTEEELLHCRSFVAFSHAEIEHYLEELCLRKVDEAIRRWNTRNSAGRTALALLAYMSERNSIAEKVTEQAANKRIEAILQSSAAAQRSAIERNHGIKQSNFAKIFVPIGIDPDGVNEILTSSLNQLGTRRGGLVHSGRTVSIKRIRDPFSDEDSDIRNIIAELAAFDELVIRTS